MRLASPAPFGSSVKGAEEVQEFLHHWRSQRGAGDDMY